MTRTLGCCLYYIDDVVTQFLTLIDEVCIIDTQLIRIDTVGNVCKVLTLEVRTVVIDFVLDILRLSV